MNCDDVMTLLLEGEPASRAAATDPALREHLRGCHECRMRAEQLAEAEAELRRMYSSVTVPTAATASTGRRRGVGRALLWPAAGVAALATVALVAVRIRQNDSPAVPPQVAADANSTGVAVEVPDGRNAIVFATKNPLVSVVWIY